MEPAMSIDDLPAHGSGTFSVAPRAKSLRVVAPAASDDAAAVPGHATTVLAHDLKSPLGAISLNLEFLVEELGPVLTPELRAAFEDCKMAVAKAVRIVDTATRAARRASRVPPAPSAA
jgi:signal transduction histidine kinase